MFYQSFEVDDRQPPDKNRKREFRKGWENALQREQKGEYTDKTLNKLTWNNLGYRLGKLFGDSPDELIEGLYDWCVLHYEELGPIKGK